MTEIAWYTSRKFDMYAIRELFRVLKNQYGLDQRLSEFSNLMQEASRAAKMQGLKAGDIAKVIKIDTNV